MRDPENLLFGCWEYHGDDFEADMAAMAADPETHDRAVSGYVCRARRAANSGQ